MPPEDIVARAFKVLKSKLTGLRDVMERHKLNAE